MGISMADLHVPYNTEDLMQAVAMGWSWLVPDGMKPILLTTMGHVFFRDAAGAVYWLDTMYGEFSRVADSAADFQRAAKTDEKLEEWFLAEIVSIMHAIGRAPAKGKVLSFQLPIVLGGEAAPDNLDVCDALSHVLTQGQICDQLRHIPDGASITGVEETAPGVLKLLWEK